MNTMLTTGPDEHVSMAQQLHADHTMPMFATKTA